MTKADLIKKVTVEQRLEGGEGVRQAGMRGRNGRCKGPVVGVCWWRSVGWAEQARGGGEEKPERQQGMECTPQMALRLPLPSERKPALFPRPYLMLWLEEPARAGVRVA